MNDDMVQLIQDMANDEWVDRLPRDLPPDKFDELSEEWDARTQAFLKGERKAEELHLFVDMFNWDGGIEELKLVAKNPSCDVATALMMFWRGQPQEYIGVVDVPGYMPDYKGFLEGIQEKVVRGEYRGGACSYDPMEELGEDIIRYIPPIAQEMIPGRLGPPG